MCNYLLPRTTPNGLALPPCSVCAVWRLSNETAGKLPYAMDVGYSYDCECQ